MEDCWLEHVAIRGQTCLDAALHKSGKMIVFALNCDDTFILCSVPILIVSKHLWRLFCI